MTYVLIVDHDDDYDPADIHGPFLTITSAQLYAERYRAQHGLPMKATAQNNDEWTELGWYFGIVKPRLLESISLKGVEIAR